MGRSIIIFKINVFFIDKVHKMLNKKSRNINLNK